MPRPNQRVRLLSWALFWPIAYFVPREYLFDVVNALGISLGGSVLFAYAPGVVDAIRRPDDLKKAHYLILGIVATWVAMVARTAYLWGWRWLGEPEGGLDATFVAFIGWLVISGGVLHLLAPKVLEGTVPRTGWFGLWVALVVGLVLGASIVLLKQFK